MAKGKKGKKQKKENEYVVDTVDTTSLNLKQLQIYCDKVYQEIVKTERESRNLELERNKLKTMVDLSTQELIKARATRMGKEFDLWQTHENITFATMETQNQIRWVKNEKNEELTACTVAAGSNVEILQRDSDESRNNVEQDMKQLRAAITRQDTDRQNKIIVLKQELEQAKSNLFNTKDNDYKLQASGYEKKMSELTSRLKKIYGKETEAFNDYKIKRTNDFLSANDKFNTNLRHYYEKLLQRNMNVLNGLHEKYKTVRAEVQQIQSTMKSHKETAGKNVNEIGSNNVAIKELTKMLANSKSDQKTLKDIKRDLDIKQKKLRIQRYDNLFLEEAMKFKKKDEADRAQEKERLLSNLRLGVISEMLKFECWAGKIRSYLNKISTVVQSQVTIGSENSNMSIIRVVAFAQLEAEAKEEEKYKTGGLTSPTSSHIDQNSLNILPSKIN